MKLGVIVGGLNRLAVESKISICNNLEARNKPLVYLLCALYIPGQSLISYGSREFLYVASFLVFCRICCVLVLFVFREKGDPSC